MTKASERPYHHGDLRRTIIDTAMEMLREEKNWQFTLRELARRADVSHGAPYKHFPDKAALLAELAMIGFDRLREALTVAGSSLQTSPRDALLPMAKAYVAFGVENPALYRLMFSAEANHSTNLHLSDRALGVFNILREVLERGQALGFIRSRPILGQAAACWAIIHGMTMLSIDQLLLPEKVGTAPLESALATLMEGLSNGAD
jgi:AcrR family transcriptional regulator